MHSCIHWHKMTLLTCTENHTQSMPDLHFSYIFVCYMYCFGRMVTYVEDIKCSANTAQRLFLLAGVETRLIWSHCRCSMFCSFLSYKSGLALFSAIRRYEEWFWLTWSGVLKYLLLELCDIPDKNIWTNAADQRSTMHKVGIQRWLPVSVQS